MWQYRLTTFQSSLRSYSTSLLSPQHFEGTGRHDSNDKGDKRMNPSTTNEFLRASVLWEQPCLIKVHWNWNERDIFQWTTPFCCGNLALLLSTSPLSTVP